MWHSVPYIISSDSISNIKNLLFSCLMDKHFDAIQSPIGGSFQSLQPITERHCYQAGESGNKRCWYYTLKGYTISGWYKGLLSLLVPTCQSAPLTTVKFHSDGEHVLHVHLLLSLFHYWFTIVNTSSMTFSFPYIYYHNCPLRSSPRTNNAICDCVCVHV